VFPAELDQALAEDCEKAPGTSETCWLCHVMLRQKKPVATFTIGGGTIA
jgi:hypothetical protein